MLSSLLLAAALTGGPLADPAGVWPLAPTSVVRGFEAPPSPYAAGHRGVDLDGSAGQTVRSAVAGTITFAGSVAGRGVVVVSLGDGRRTTYEPVVADVVRGDEVTAGAPLGSLSGAGSHCAPSACLHWGLVDASSGSDVYLDPLSLLGVVRVRLLPWGGSADGAWSPAVSPVGASRPDALPWSAWRWTG
ncbi:M23 family metallopeptidase [Nocardioides sp. GY 10127]|uniref:M23 family metallopeptidase n=1 Tax=Nocardioides sp. GY 10127 TaxID=2569762 RepID=UPI0010A81D6F|nr:M23 family metallopeptidase [Nocardioides sp. GY 10127]TIC80856.1 M23 family metallopeptidase [Nocardioides sp. GY 10127]